MFSALLKKAVKRALLPARPGLAATPFGLAAGRRIWVDPDHAFRVWAGLYERELAPHFRRLLTPGAKCFDVGGDKGYYAVVLAAAGGPVVSFELEDRHVEIIRRVAEANPRLSIAVEQCLVGDGSGGTITLDDAAERHFLPDFVKMDIEGSEAAALAGAPRLLAARRTSFIIETHGSAVEERCVALLEQSGYAVTRIGLATGSAEAAMRLPHYDHNGWVVAVPR